MFEDEDTGVSLARVGDGEDIRGIFGGGTSPGSEDEETSQEEQSEPESYVTRLTDWPNEPGIFDLSYDVTSTLNNRNYHAERIRRWRDMYHCRGEYSGYTGDRDHDTKRSTVQPKLVATQAEWRIAMLSEPFLSTDDVFEVNPQNTSSIKAAIQQSTILNYQWRTQLDKVALINKLVRILCIDGTAVLRVGWDTQEITEEVVEPLYQLNNPNPFNMQALQAQLQTGLQMKQQAPDLYDATMDDQTKIMVMVYESSRELVEPVQVGTQTVEKSRMVRNAPMVEVCVPENFYVDPSCEGDMDKAQFVARTFATCRGWLEASSVNYQNLDEVAWEAGETRASAEYEDVTDPTYEASDSTRHKCIATEYWGKWDIYGNGTLVPIVATWIGQTLIRLEENPYPDGKPPFVFISYTPQPYSVYGTPDAELTIANQRIIGSTMRGIIDVMAKSSAGQRGISKGALDEINFQRFQDGHDYMFNPGVNMQSAIYTHDFPPMNPTSLNLIQQQMAEAEALSGVRPFQGTVDSPNVSSVMQSSLGSIDASAIREADILKRISNGLVQIGKKIVAMNELFLTPKDVVRITKDKFVPIDTDNLSGEFDLSVSIQTQAQNSAKSKGLLFILQTCGPQMDPEMHKLILGEAARLLGLNALAQSIEQYEPQPDPSAIQKQQMDAAMVQANIAKLGASAQKAQADAAHKQAQTTELVNNTRSLNQGYDTIIKALVGNRKKDDLPPDVANAVTLVQAMQRQTQQQQAQQAMQQAQAQQQQQQAALQANAAQQSQEGDLQ